MADQILAPQNSLEKSYMAIPVLSSWVWWDGWGSAPDRLLPTEVVPQKNMTAHLIYSCWEGALIYTTGSASPWTQQPPSPLFRCTKHGSDSKTKALRNITALPFSGVLLWHSQMCEKPDNDSCLFLQLMQKFRQCQVLEAGEKLCSSLCKCREHVAELPPQCKHWTFMGLVLKGSNSAARSDVFIQMKNEIKWDLIWYSDLSQWHRYTLAHQIPQPELPVPLTPTRFSPLYTEVPAVGISDTHFT